MAPVPAFHPSSLLRRCVYTQRDVISRMEDFLVRLGTQVRADEHTVLDGMDGTGVQIASLDKLDPSVVGWVQGLISSAAVGVATPDVLRTVGIRVGNAGTGAAKRALHGAARDRALLALFGGGPCVAGGGGGMALGAHILTAASGGGPDEPSTYRAGGCLTKGRGDAALCLG